MSDKEFLEGVISIIESLAEERNVSAKTNIIWEEAEKRLHERRN